MSRGSMILTSQALTCKGVGGEERRCMGNGLYFKMASEIQRWNYRAVLTRWSTAQKTFGQLYESIHPFYHWFSWSQVLIHKVKYCRLSLSHHLERRPLKPALSSFKVYTSSMVVLPSTGSVNFDWCAIENVHI